MLAAAATAAGCLDVLADAQANDLAVDAVPDVRAMRLPEGAMSPQAAVDRAGHVHLIYVTGDPAAADISYIRSSDAGHTFAPPLRVNSQPRSAMSIGAVRGPHLALGKNGRAHVAWNGSNLAQPRAAGSNPTPMLYARLNDAGDQFEPQRNLVTTHAGLDGGGSVAADPDGNVYVAWHAPQTDRTETDRQVWLARSSDEGKTFSPEIAVNPKRLGACGCCGLKIASVGGRVYIAYRTAGETVDRDMNLLASTDKGRTFSTVGVDPWKIGACVMSTADVSGVDSRAVAAWESHGHINFGRPNEKPMKISTVPGDRANQKHPAVAVNHAGQFIIAWTIGAGWNKGGAAGWQVFAAGGDAIKGASGVLNGLPAWTFPAVFANGDGSFVVTF